MVRDAANAAPHHEGQLPAGHALEASRVELWRNVDGPEVTVADVLQRPHIDHEDVEQRAITDPAIGAPSCAGVSRIGM